MVNEGSAWNRGDVDYTGVCYRIATAPGPFPQASSVNALDGLVLLFTFIMILKRVNDQTKRALAGVDDTHDSLCFSIHITMLQAASVWAIVWAVYKLFSTDDDSDSSWKYHAAAAGMVYACSCFIEMIVWVYFLMSDAGERALKRTALISLGITCVYTIGHLYVLIEHPGLDQYLMSGPVILFYMIWGLIVGVFYMGIFVGTYLGYVRVVSTRSLNKYCRFLGVYYLFMALGRGLEYGHLDIGTCMQDLALLIYFAKYAVILYEVLLTDSQDWKQLIGKSLFTEQQLFSDVEEAEVPENVQAHIIPCTQMMKASSEPLGHGMFATVYKYKWAGQDVALKKLSLKMSSEEYSADLSREASFLRMLNHPNIVKFLGVYFDPPHMGIVMEFCEGGSLEHVLKTKAFDFSKSTPLRVALGIAQAMEYIHTRKRLLHRDLKSGNVLLTGDYVPKLTDFGEAKIFIPEQRATNNSVHGTPAYMAPEIAVPINSKGSITAVFSSDVYAFGTVLWELLTWDEPYVVSPDTEDVSTIRQQVELASSLLDDAQEQKSTDMAVPLLRPETSRRDIQNVEDVRKFIAQGRARPPIPSACPDPIKQILQSCWEEDPDLRPSFKELVAQLEDNLTCIPDQDYPLVVEWS